MKMPQKLRRFLIRFKIGRAFFIYQHLEDFAVRYKKVEEDPYSSEGLLEFFSRKHYRTGWEDGQEQMATQAWYAAGGHDDWEYDASALLRALQFMNQAEEEQIAQIARLQLQVTRQHMRLARAMKEVILQRKELANIERQL